VAGMIRKIGLECTSWALILSSLVPQRVGHATTCTAAGHRLAPVGQRACSSVKVKASNCTRRPPAIRTRAATAAPGSLGPLPPRPPDRLPWRARPPSAAHRRRPQPPPAAQPPPMRACWWPRLLQALRRRPCLWRQPRRRPLAAETLALPPRCHAPPRPQRRRQRLRRR